MGNAGRKAPRRKKSPTGKAKAKRKVGAGKRESKAEADKCDVDFPTEILKKYGFGAPRRVTRYHTQLKGLDARGNDLAKKICGFMEKYDPKTKTKRKDVISWEKMSNKQLEEFIIKILAMVEGVEGKYRSLKQQKSAKGMFEALVKCWEAQSGFDRESHMTLERFEEDAREKFPKEFVYPRKSDLENRMWN